MKPFQRKLPILQNTINNCDTFRDNFPKCFAETLSQTGVSCSFIMSYMFPTEPIFYSKVAIVESEMSRHAGQEKYYHGDK